MSNNSLNLALRFFLELGTLVALGYWGWRQAAGPWRYMPGILVPVTAAAMWGVFRVPGDTSASGEAVVAVPGIVRLILELACFGFAAWGLISEGARPLGLILAGAVIVHYAFSSARVLWLLRQ